MFLYVCVCVCVCVYLNFMSINLLKFMQYAQMLNVDEYDYVDGSVIGEEKTEV